MSFLVPDSTTATFSSDRVMVTKLKQSATLADGEDAMSMTNLLPEILRQVSALNDKVDDVKQSMEEKIDRVEEQISGEDGLRDRVKALEMGADTRMKALEKTTDDRLKSLEDIVQTMVDKEPSSTPITIHHAPPSARAKRAKMKENATVVAVGGVGATLLVQLVDALPKIIDYFAK